jgi:hypothetical protein
VVDNYDDDGSVSVSNSKDAKLVDSHVPTDITGNEETFPRPKWYAKEQASSMIDKHCYNDYFISLLRARYSQLVVDYLKIDQTCHNDVESTCNTLVRLLRYARESLEREDLGRHDLLIISNLLDLAEQCMVWLYPINMVETKSGALFSRLIEKDPISSNDLINKLHTIGKFKEYNEKYQILEESTRVCNKKDLEEKINTGLQIERLTTIRYWGLILLLLFSISYPLVTDIGKWPNYANIISHVDSKNSFEILISSWAITLSIAIIGAIGGFLSGLLQVRSSKTSLALYEESKLLFQIRPIFGAFAALVCIMLLSGGALSGIVTGSGSYALVAFASGFSERYFLKLLNIKPDQEQSTVDNVKETDRLKLLNKKPYGEQSTVDSVNKT